MQQNLLLIRAVMTVTDLVGLGGRPLANTVLCNKQALWYFSEETGIAWSNCAARHSASYCSAAE
jgi:hypothetical protein